jgi:DNA end-binding protein Ku
MRAIWSGNLSLGFLNIPVKIATAVRERKFEFHNLCPDCLVRVEQKYTCPKCGREVKRTEAKKGYQVSKDHLVVVEPQDLEALKLKTIKTIEIVGFCDQTAIDPIYYDASYWLLPGENAERAYHLLRTVMSRLGLVALARITFHNREHTAVVRFYGKGMLLHTLYYPSEVVEPVDIPEPPPIAEKEIQVGQQLLEAYKTEPDLTKFSDRYRDSVEELIRAKESGQAVRVPVAQEVRATVDLMEALQKSLEAMRKKKEEAVAVA